jgi:hypothetical protein
MPKEKHDDLVRRLHATGIKMFSGGSALRK